MHAPGLGGVQVSEFHESLGYLYDLYSPQNRYLHLLCPRDRPSQPMGQLIQMHYCGVLVGLRQARNEVNSRFGSYPRSQELGHPTNAP